MKDPPRLFSSMRHDDDSGVTEASGTDLRFSVSLTNPFCFQGTNSGFFWRLLQQHPAPCSRRGPRVAAEGQACATGVRWALPRARGLVRCSWQRCRMERKPPIKPTDLVLLNGFLVPQTLRQPHALRLQTALCVFLVKIPRAELPGPYRGGTAPVPQTKMQRASSFPRLDKAP